MTSTDNHRPAPPATARPRPQPRPDYVPDDPASHPDYVPPAAAGQPGADYPGAAPVPAPYRPAYSPPPFAAPVTDPSPPAPGGLPPAGSKRRAQQKKKAAAAANRPHRTAGGVKEYRPSRLALRAVDGYLTRTPAGIQAWFVEPPVAWSMRKSEDREARIVARAQRYAELAEQDVVEVHMRVTHRPWPVGQWARDHDRWARQASPPPGDVPGALSWDALMHGEQRSKYARVPTNKTVYCARAERAGRSRGLPLGAAGGAGPGAGAAQQRRRLRP